MANTKNQNPVPTVGSLWVTEPKGRVARIWYKPSFRQPSNYSPHTPPAAPPAAAAALDTPAALALLERIAVAQESLLLIWAAAAPHKPNGAARPNGEAVTRG